MLPNRNRRLQQLGQTDQKWSAIGGLAPGDYKAGHGVDAFVHVGRDEAQLRTKGAGLTLDANKTVLRPGQALSIPLNFARVAFETHAFNPLANQASTAVLPVPTFVRSLPGLDPDLRMLTGMMMALEALRQAVV
jgi:hypothetical protein